MTHHEYCNNPKTKPPRPCTAQDMTFGGKCLNCGYEPSQKKGASVDSFKTVVGAVDSLAKFMCSPESTPKPQAHKKHRSHSKHKAEAPGDYETDKVVIFLSHPDNARLRKDIARSGNPEETAKKGVRHAAVAGAKNQLTYDLVNAALSYVDWAKVLDATVRQE